MSSTFPNPALRFEPSFETVEEDEAETTASLLESLQGIAETTTTHCKHAMRSVHAKSHGLIRGELRVLDNLPPELAQGLFAEAGSYPVVMRLSTSPGDILDDSVSTPRGLAVKVMGVEGERLDGSESDVTQDFVMVNGPAFLVKDAKSFVKNLSLLEKTTDKAEGLKKIFSATLRGVEKVIESVGGQSGTIMALGGHPETNILGETFYSQVPILYGAYMAKLCVAPISPELTALTKAPLDINGKPNALRQAVLDFFADNDAEWEVRIQLCTDLDKMPIDDASAVWPEDVSPYIAVARITAPAQQTWSEDRSIAIEDGLSFSPWHGLAAHRPLGSLNRVRKTVYATMAKARESYNGVSVTEPKSLDDITGLDNISGYARSAQQGGVGISPSY